MLLGHSATDAFATIIKNTFNASDEFASEDSIVRFVVQAFFVVVCLTPCIGSTTRADTEFPDVNPGAHVNSICGNGSSYMVSTIRYKDGSWSYCESYMNGRTGQSWSKMINSWELQKQPELKLHYLNGGKRQDTSARIINPFFKPKILKPKRTKK